MKYTRTANDITFNTRIDYVRIEKEATGYKIYADADDREAIYLLSEDQTAAVAEALGMQPEAEFLDLVENAINSGKSNEVFSAAIKDAESEFFWMNTEQIERYLIGGEQPGPIEKD
ncbi:MAG: hypothetical protein RLZZ345_499 [Actinomycetota bacterium]|jgi:hypothetical protein